MDEAWKRKSKRYSDYLDFVLGEVKRLPVAASCDLRSGGDILG